MRQAILNTRTFDTGPFCVLSLTGAVDRSAAPQLRTQLIDLLGRNRYLLADFTHIQSFDSAVIAVLVEVLWRARDRGLSFGLVGVSGSALGVLRLARLDQVFPLFDSLEQALSPQA